jgi:predicted AAA+ superfamily ATPase
MFNLDNFLTQNKWRLDAKALDSFYFPRECINRILDKATDPNPLLLKGPRGAGKTTILHIMIKHLITKLSIPPENIFYFNLDDPLSCNFFRSSDDVINFIKGFVPKNDKQVYLILDEIQHLITAVSEPLVLVREIAEKLFPDRASGQAGKLILTSSRTGFAPALNELFQFDIQTFGFKDYLNRMLNTQNIYLPELKENSAAYLTRVMTSDYSKLILPYLDDYLIHGGYPLVVRKFNPEEKPELLRQVYEAGFRELLAFGGKINQPERFTKLIQVLAQINGELQKIMVVAKECGLSRATIEHYRDILADNYFVSAVYPGGDESRSGAPIVYFNDTGLRNRLISLFHKPDTRIDRDNLLNNFLYRNLAMLDGKINYLRIGRTNRIIFNFKHTERVILAIVLYDYPQRKSGHRGLVSLAGRIKPQKVIILTRDYFQYEKIANTAFICLPATMAWLLPEVFGIRDS